MRTAIGSAKAMLTGMMATKTVPLTSSKREAGDLGA